MHSVSILLQVGVKIFLESEEGKFLLLKRSQNKYPTIKNLWDIPGGRINPGTALIENLQREVLEETDLAILGEPKLLYAQDILKSEKHIVRLTFRARANGEPRLNDESTDFRWSSVDEMLQLPTLDEFTLEVLEKRLLN